MRIYVGNLNFRTDAEMLRDVFSEYGEVSDVHVVMDRETGRSRGFGFVEMTNDEEAEAAMKALNGAEVDGRTLTVNQARERTEGGGGGGGRGGFRGGRGGGGGGGRGGYGGGGRGGRRDEW